MRAALRRACPRRLRRARVACRLRVALPRAWPRRRPVQPALGRDLLCRHRLAASGLDMLRHSSLGILAACTDVRSLPAFAPWRQAPVCSRVASAAGPCGGKAADAMMTMVMLMVMAMMLTMMPASGTPRAGSYFSCRRPSNSAVSRGSSEHGGAAARGRVSSTGVSTPWSPRRCRRRGCGRFPRSLHVTTACPARVRAVSIK